MSGIQLYNVAPAMPENLAFLEALARNMWWSWNSPAIDLFRRISGDLWRETGHNPVEFLNRVPQSRLEAVAGNDGFLKHLEEVRTAFITSLTSQFPATTDAATPCIGYFSLEYGIHESVRLYSGGLGALAGDHMKAASDLGLPLVGVGLMYRQGYFQQRLDENGWQQEYYPDNQIHCLPLSEACNEAGHQVRVSVPLPEGRIEAAVWQLDIGRVRLCLLDTNLLENPPEFRSITGQLYGGDRRNRLRQELVLGIGGFRALVELGWDPQICHMNEGHAAFLSLARIHHLVERYGLDVPAAYEVVYRSGVFTTHTPVPAGNETFDIGLVRPYIDVLAGELGIPAESILEWGRAPGETTTHELSMTIMGLHMAQFSNGVSRLHGEVARRMWQHLWPGRPEDEIPIHHVTNGVHVPSWLSSDHTALYDRYLGDAWRLHPSDHRFLSGIDQIPDEELWRTHELGRSRLVRHARELMESQMRARNSASSEIARAKSVLDHDVLTIGFARRFATYKRATLLLHDPDRLEAIIANAERPVQFLFAGKSHPADDHGKELIKALVHFARRPRVQGRVLFLENYDIGLARRMVQGVDVWLNTPRRPHEASGTSGMKAAVNGGLHLSVLDGWWCEGYSPDCGWSIGDGEHFDDAAYQDAVEARALFNVLEDQVIPCFYEREAGDMPTRWLRMMKASIRMGLGFFTSHRMVEEYDERFYSTARAEYERLMADGAAIAMALVEQRVRLKTLWPKVSCGHPIPDREIGRLHVGDKFTVEATVMLGDLRPEEVDVDVYFGPVNSKNEITSSHTELMSMHEERGNGAHIYRRELQCTHTGRYGFTARVTPHGAEWKNVLPGFMTWADGS